MALLLENDNKENLDYHENLKEHDDHDGFHHRELGGGDNNGGYLVDANGNSYPPYSLSWRYLGMFIDNNNCDNRRRLEDGGGGNSACRKVLWAAYHDPGYSGQGIAEYKFYSRDNGSWDGSTCRARTYGLWWPFTRCRRLDCHMKHTKLNLVGVYKETDGLYDFTEQLFKHQGYCLWDEDKNNNGDGSRDSQDSADNNNNVDDDDSNNNANNKYSDYNFMTTISDNWVNGCTQLEGNENAVENGNYLYYDTKPLPGGDITYGVYTDANCLTESKTYTWADLQNNYNKNNNNDESWMTSDAAFDRWNRLLSDYKICQPCRAYNRIRNNNKGSHDDSGSGSGDNSEDYYYEEEDGDDGQGGKDRYGFNCYDAAGYLNCNQCYKFQTQTNMESASISDLEAATKQGTILAINVDGKTYGKGYYRAPGRTLYVFKQTSIVLLAVAALLAYYWYRKNYYRNNAGSGLNDKLTTIKSSDDDYDDDDNNNNNRYLISKLAAGLRRFYSQNDRFAASSSSSTRTTGNTGIMNAIMMGMNFTGAGADDDDHEKKMLLAHLKERDIKLAKQEQLIRRLQLKIQYYEKDYSTRRHQNQSFDSPSSESSLANNTDDNNPSNEIDSQQQHQLGVVVDPPTTERTSGDCQGKKVSANNDNVDQQQWNLMTNYSSRDQMRKSEPWLPL